MKLDLELCREILQRVEVEGGIDGLEVFPSIPGEMDDVVYYQIKKMTEAGYVKHKRYLEDKPYQLFKIEVTFQGHEFLKQMLDDTIWQKTKDIAKKGGISLTFETIKAIIPIAVQTLIKSINPS